MEFETNSLYDITFPNEMANISEIIFDLIV